MALETNSEPGDIYQENDGSLWKVIGYQPNPTIIIQQITEQNGEPLDPEDGRRQQSHAVGCLNAEPFTKIGTFAK